MSPTSDVLPWHEALWAQVRDGARAGKLGHALLLAGPAGVGKRRFARRLAASLLCESKTESGAACTHCRGCTQFSAGTHPNLIWLSREIDEKTDKEKRDISMEQLRRMMERLGLSSHYGQTRVVVIEPADALNASGANALLKTIEEPPAGCHVLLISERPMALAPTLRSRCQRLNFATPDRVGAMAWLRDAAPEIDAEGALQDSAGAPLAALEAAQSGLFRERSAWGDGLLAVAEQRLDPMSAAARVGKDQAQEWLRHFLRVLHRALRALAGDGQDAREERIARRLGAAHLEQLLAEAIEGQRRLLGNANPQLTVESLMISWWRRAAPIESGRNTNP